MIYTFRFISDEEDSFVIDVNINHNQTFEQLHKVLQTTLNYDQNQLASFFSATEAWEKEQEIALLDMGDDSSVLTMANTKIEDFFSAKNERILYIFDYFNERLFFGSIVRTIDAEPPIELPSISKIEGTIPEQINTLTDSLDNLDLDLDLEDEDDDGFNFEELPDDYDSFDPNDY